MSGSEKGGALRGGARGRYNARFVVTNLATTAKLVYEEVCCRRGQIENRIKELKDGLSIDRAGCTSFFANQLRMLLTAAAYLLMQESFRGALEVARSRLRSTVTSGR